MPTHQSHTLAGRLEPTRRPKPAKECACPTREKKFSKMPHATKKKDKTIVRTDKNKTLSRLTLWSENKKNEKHDAPIE